MLRVIAQASPQTRIEGRPASATAPRDRIAGFNARRRVEMWKSTNRISTFPRRTKKRIDWEWPLHRREGRSADIRGVVGAHRFPHQVFVEPANDVLETLDAVPRLPAARELVVLSREPHHHRWPLQVLERAEQFLPAGRRRRAPVLVAEDEHQRSFNP